MKLYKNLVNAVASVLQEIFKEKRYADKAIERVFKQNPQWGSRDRRFVAEAVYDIVRYFRLYSTLAESNTNYWFITAVWLSMHEDELPDWPEFKHVNAVALKQKRESFLTQFEIKESVPDWLMAAGSTELGEESWKREITAMNEQALVYLRVNTLKTTIDKLKSALAANQIETDSVADAPNALVLKKRTNIFQNSLFKEGWFEVQDAGSQMISEMLNPQQGETVIDACAGAGGKSLHLAALMKNKGKLISMDVEGWKLEELKKRARRAGAFNIEPKVIEGEQTVKSLNGRADKLLLDVPCSGLGVLKRNPDAKWKLSPEIIEKTKAIQKHILHSYPSMLKPGGVMLYSTCSILPSENQAQVNEFLQNHSEYTMIKEKTLLPSEGFDGFYMALIKKGS